MTPASPHTATDFAALALHGGPWYEGPRGAYGGAYVPEVIAANLAAVAEGFAAIREDAAFAAELSQLLNEFAGRPTPLTPLHRLSDELGGARVYLKNEGLLPTGAHKLNHCLGQALLARRLGKRRIIAETGAGQHGYATATVCARLGLDCTVYIGAKDYARQRPNVYWMELLGATVVPVTDGDQTLNDAVIAAFKDLISHPDDTYYLLGSAVGPHPYPAMNAHFQAVVGQEARAQVLAQAGRLPAAALACVGGGSNALGLFSGFLNDAGVRLIGVEAGGRATEPGAHAADAPLGAHAAKLSRGKLGIFEGYRSYFLQDGAGNIAGTGSISAGLDYCGASPILAALMDAGRLEAAAASDAATLAAVQRLARTEGLVLALESAHALAHALELAPQLSPDECIVVNGSGRGEKDLFITMRALQPEALRAFCQSQLAAFE